MLLLRTARRAPWSQRMAMLSHPFTASPPSSCAQDVACLLGVAGVVQLAAALAATMTANIVPQMTLFFLFTGVIGSIGIFVVPAMKQDKGLSGLLVWTTVVCIPAQRGQRRSSVASSRGRAGRRRAAWRGRGAPP